MNHECRFIKRQSSSKIQWTQINCLLNLSSESSSPLLPIFSLCNHSLPLSMISCKASSFNFETSPSHQITLKRYLPSLQAKHPSHKNTIVSSSSSSIEGQKWNTRATHTTAKASQRAKKFQKEEEEGEGERKMHYEVKVISWRERRIKAQILVYADIQSVWNALTDYERLADFIPNLVCR